MQAIRVHHFGGLDSLVAEDVPRPAPGDGAIDATKRVLVHGAAGNVGAYATQLARRVAHEMVATAFSDDVAYVQTLGADRVIDMRKSRFEEVLTDVDVVLDTIGGETQDRSFTVLKHGGALVSAVAAPDQQKAARNCVRALCFLVEVSSRRLQTHCVPDRGR